MSSPTGGMVKRPRIQRKWVANEVLAIVEYLKECVRSGKALEKPTGDSFYQEMLNEITIPDCTFSQLKGKVKNMRENYRAVLLWRSQNGQRLLECEGFHSFRKATLKKCPNFEDLDEIFGSKTDIYPPDLLQNTSAMAEENSTDPMADETDSIRNLSPIVVLECHDIEEAEFIKEESKPITDKCRMKKSGWKSSPEARRIETVDIDVARLDFEKEKWKEEVKMQREKWHEEVTIQKQKWKDELELRKYEIDLKYKTQLEIAKLSKSD